MEIMRSGFQFAEAIIAEYESTVEADVFNMALFGMTAKQWRDENPDHC